ncbi:MAG: hypothetical protein D6719_04070 [Candidatus Dadabacteria bacterium]|nr:MAG: hypothetical protein D6719_04070 [Candidatus Dadabacteria bacterium]
MSISRFIILTLSTAIVLFATQAQAVEYACFQTDTDSFPIKITDQTEKKLKQAKTKSAVLKKKNRIKVRLKAVKSLIRRIKKGNLSKTKQKKKVTRFRSKIINLKDKLSFLSRVLKLLRECRNGKISQYFPVIREYQQFSLAKGEKFSTNNDLTIRSLEAITINGEISGKTNYDGTGSSITLEALSGDITLANGAVVAAGDGENAATSTLVSELNDISTGAGMSGGNITFKAPQGELIVDPGATIHIGNGGDGADISISDSVIKNSTQTIELKNGGGDSGFLYIQAEGIKGLDIEKVSATLLDEQNQEVSINAWRLNSLSGITGGSGGEAGQFKVVESKGLLLRAQKVSRKGGTITVKGADGASALINPTKGQNAVFKANSRSGRGQDGISVRAFGGRGGDCYKRDVVDKLFLVFSKSCTPQPGGNAKATASSGTKGFNPAFEGGNGGSATAQGGCGGITPGVESSAIFASCGNAEAYAGKGGFGGGDCPNNVKDTGGMGGNGGKAKADASCSACFLGSKGNLRASATAQGGLAGPGGSGKVRGGAAGNFGVAIALGAAGKTSAIDGKPSSAGSVCSSCNVKSEQLLIGVSSCADLQTQEFVSGDGFGSCVNDSGACGMGSIQLSNDGTGNLLLSTASAGTLSFAANGNTADGPTGITLPAPLEGQCDCTLDCGSNAPTGGFIVKCECVGQGVIECFQDYLPTSCPSTCPN